MSRFFLFLAAWLILALGRPASGQAQDWPQWGGRPERNMVSSATSLPDDFDPGTGKGATTRPATLRNVKWAVKLGSHTYGNPTVAGGKVFVGTNSASIRDPRCPGDRGVLLCLSEADGRLLWRLMVPKIPALGAFNGDYAGLGICSSPTVEGDRVYVVTNRCEVLCLDVNGLADGNDGPFQDEARYLAKPLEHKVTPGPDGPVVQFVPGEPVELNATDADILWRFDLMAEVKNWPQDAASCSVLLYGDHLYVSTSNGVDRSHSKIPSPRCPSLIVLDTKSGRLLACDDADIGPRIFHGEWSSPSMGTVNGKPLLFYGAGDGFCYAFDPTPTEGEEGRPGVLRKVWWFDCNPPDYRLRDGKKLRYRDKNGPNEIIATPVFHNNRVYVAIGQDPTHGRGRGCLSCIDATGAGDISQSGRLWQYTGMDRSLSTVSIADGLLYVADTFGVVHCLDADSGKVFWTHDTKAQIWGSTFVADGKVFLGTAGDWWVFAAARDMRIINRIKMSFPVYTTPVTANGVLYVASDAWLYALK